MKVIVAGSRSVTDYVVVKDIIDKCNLNITEIVSGGARGVDSLGEQYAAEHNIPCKVFPANWSKYGKSAGPIRNQLMGEYADFAVIVWDGQSRGTQHMMSVMNKLGKDSAVALVKE